MPEDVTIGELGRRIERGFAELKEDIQHIRESLDNKVSTEVFKLEQVAQDKATEALRERVAGIEQAQVKAAADQTKTRRWWVAAVIVPIALVAFGIALQVLFTTPQVPG